MFVSVLRNITSICDGQHTWLWIVADGHIDVFRFESIADLLHSWRLLHDILLLCWRKWCVNDWKHFYSMVKFVLCGWWNCWKVDLTVCCSILLITLVCVWWCCTNEGGWCYVYNIISCFIVVAIFSTNVLCQPAVSWILGSVIGLQQTHNCIEILRYKMTFIQC